MKITGTVTSAAGRAVTGIQVVAYHGDVNLLKEKKLTAARTECDGRFNLQVGLARYPRGVNVRVAVLGNQSQEIWSSAIRYNQHDDLKIDVKLSDASLSISEYQRAADRIAPRLEGVALADLKPEQIPYLAGRSGVERRRLDSIISAAKLHVQTPKVPAEAFYGLISQGLPATTATLVAQPGKSWKAALEAAIRANQIAPLSARQSGAILSALNEQKIVATLKPPTSRIRRSPVSFVTIALKDRNKQKRVAGLIAHHNGVNADFWKAVGRNRNLTPHDRKELENHAAVGEIVGNDPELLQRISSHLARKGEDVTPRALARIGRPALLRIIDAAVRATPDAPAGTANERRAFVESTADGIANKVTAVFPTDTMRAELASGPISSYFGQYRGGLTKFFDNNPDFDIRENVSATLDPSSGSDPFRGVSDKPAVRERVGTLLRLYRALPEVLQNGPGIAPETAPNLLSKISALTDKHYYSSSAIAAKGKQQFVADLGGTSAEAEYWRHVHDRATVVRDIVQMRGMDLLETYRQRIKVMRQPQTARVQPGGADLRTLFGPLEACQCEECTSVTSPAAYLADILTFLDTDVAVAGARTPYSVLIERRPDIPHILLNCDNANREVPYIDLVNELLEDEVLRGAGIIPVWAPHRRVTLNLAPKVLDDAASDDAVAARTARATLVTTLNQRLRGYDFDQNTIQVAIPSQPPPHKWHVFDRGWLVELSSGKSKGKKVNVTWISRQTWGTQAELAANPAFRNPRATGILETGKHPLSLPPALPLLETRLFLNHLKVPRDRLIELLAPLEKDRWAVEYLGLSAAEVNLITDTQVTTSPAAWGFRAASVTANDALADPADSTRPPLTGNWLDLLRRVDVFIARAGISYIDLLDLLVTDFVNPVSRKNGTRAISIQSTDKSDPAACQLVKLQLQGTSAAFKDAIGRLIAFVRLVRRSGWTIRELDLAIRQLRPGVLDSTTLSLLAAVERTRKQLSLTRPQACALFGVIDTMRYIDHATDGQPLLPSQYDQMFLNRAVTNPVDPQFALDDEGNELRDTSISLAQGTATIAAAFEITEMEVGLLGDFSRVTTLNVKALSDLYRPVLFARGFRISIQEAIWLEKLVGTPPTGTQIPIFMDQVTRLLRSRLSVTDAWFLLHGADPLTVGLVPRDEEIAQTLGDLRTGLQKIRDEHPTPDPQDSDGTVLRKRLGELDWGEPLITALVDTVTDTKLFSVQLNRLPNAVGALLNPDPGDAIGVPLASANSVPAGVDDLVVYDPDTHLLRAPHSLNRADRKRLLLAATGNSFRKAVELLFGLGKLTHDSETLTCRGLLPSQTVAALASLDQTQAYQRAITGLADLQKQLLARKLRYCSLPIYEIPLTRTKPLVVPQPLATYVYHDPSRNVLIIRGQMTDEERDALSSAVPDLPQAILRALPLGVGTGPAPVNDTELLGLLPTSAAVDALFYPPVTRTMPATTAEISAKLLQPDPARPNDGLTPHARDLLSRRTVVSALSSAFGLAPAVTRYLVERGLPSTITGVTHMADGFRNLVDTDARAPIDPAQFSELFTDYRRLSKLALLFQRLNVEEVHLRWLFDYAAVGKWLNVSAITTGSATGGVGLAQLTELVRLFGTAARSAYTTALIDTVLKTANDSTSQLDDVLTLIRDNSKWSLEDLKEACKALSLSTAAALATSKALEDLLEALKACTQIGATVKQAERLTADLLDNDEALLAKSLAKSRHDRDRWPGIVKPINDTIREARSAALVDYLVANPRRDATTGRLLWHDVNSLYAHLLVDVQMSSCMTTSRIRLALSSVQLFVQRCLMNLEADVKVGTDPEIRKHWDEWEAWRRLHRIWQGNRDIFMRAHSYIYPDLRDDKTQPCKELENELLQNDVTQEAVETAFLHYLQKLDNIGKLEVVGLFVENGSQTLANFDDRREDAQRRRGDIIRSAGFVPEANTKPRILHVVARTYGTPPQYFYRKLTSRREWHEGVWTPWEKIDVDINSDHVLPLVWDGHLYLFWALFEKKADKATEQERQDGIEPKNRWHIKLAWSELIGGQWSPKRVSTENLRSLSFEDPYRTIETTEFEFRSEVLSDRVIIKCYGPISHERQPPPSTSTAPERPGWTLLLQTANVGFVFVNEDSQVVTNLKLIVYRLRDGSELATLRSDSKGRVYVWNNVPLGDRGEGVDIRFDNPDWSMIGFGLVPWDWTEASDAGRDKFTAYRVQVKHIDPQPIAPEEPQPRPQPPRPPDDADVRFGRFEFLACRSDPRPVGEPGMNERLTDPMPVLQGMLGQLPASAKIVLPHQSLQFDATQPFFYQDDAHVYCVTLPANSTPAKHRFDVFYHPYVCNFIASFHRKGLKDVLTLQSQSLDDNGSAFSGYAPDTSRVQTTRLNAYGTTVQVSREYVDFELSGSYSIYNWELFFHVPFLAASKLSTNLRGLEARQMLHFIFDPTSRPGTFSPGTPLKPTQRFWNVRPFWEIEGRDILSIDDLLRGSADLSEQYAQWRENPFMPFVIARLRQSELMKATVGLYIDNLFGMADQKARLSQIEAIDEAIQYYIMISDILGPPPEKIPPRARPTLQTYASMQQQARGLSGTALDTWRNFSDLMVTIEAYISPSSVPSGGGTSNSALGSMWAFCIPGDSSWQKYWTQLADRLFKLRHCQDLEGNQRRIPLWDPPIDPALLVRAAAAGVDLDSVLNDINAALPNYRFMVMAPKGVELCRELIGFGAALVSVLEKKDAEELAQLRSQHEVRLLEKVRDVRLNQLKEATATRIVAERSKLTVQARRDHYRNLEYMIPPEQAGLALSGLAVTQEAIGAVNDIIAAIAAWVPQFKAGASGVASTPVLVTEYGGEQVSRGASAAATASKSFASILSTMASMSQTVGSYMRRREEWRLQELLANKELDQIDKQIEAAMIREAIAQNELVNHDLQAEQSRAVDEHLRTKYTNRELWSRHEARAVAVHFQIWKVVFDHAKKTERAFRYELGLADSSYVQFGYWDSLMKGLFAGERLLNDLRRMEAAYLDGNSREHELTRHVSLAALNPAALLVLKNVGECEVDIPEWLFDMDHPGHYMRRNKALAFSIPCVVGPYTNVNCTITQSFSRVRKDASAVNYADASHFHENFGSSQSIVTSTGREDSGLFELNLRDERFLPFEGTGAIARYRIRLARAENQWDVDSMSDFIFHIRYTSRSGGDPLREAAKAAIPKTGMRLFDVRSEFGQAWSQFKNPPTGQSPTLTLHFTDAHFPLHSADQAVFIQSLEVLGAVDAQRATQLPLTVALGGKSNDYSLAVGSGPGDLRSQEKKFGKNVGDTVITAAAADAAAVRELMLLCRYELKKKP